MADSFYAEEELKGIGFKKCGNNVKISKKVSIYGAENISIGDHVRIDDFCVLSGNISLGNYIHLAVYVALFGGKAGIEMQDYTTLSARTVVYAESDDYSGKHMTNPTIPVRYLGVIERQVVLERHVIVGAGCTILPGVTIGEGSAVGSMSLVNNSLNPWGIYVGIPCRYLKERSKKILVMTDEFLHEMRGGGVKSLRKICKDTLVKRRCAA